MTCFHRHIYSTPCKYSSEGVLCEETPSRALTTKHDASQPYDMVSSTCAELKSRSIQGTPVFIYPGFRSSQNTIQQILQYLPASFPCIVLLLSSTDLVSSNTS